MAGKEELQTLIDAWVGKKGYLLPHRTVSDAAESIGTNSRALYSFFKDQGKDFRSWRTSLRMEEAKKIILQEPQEPFSHIARRTGYMDRSNFTNAFKACTGTTPSGWKKKNS